jgi:hypothetical protein
MEPIAKTPDTVTIEELEELAATMQRSARAGNENGMAEINMALQRKGPLFGLFSTKIQRAHERLTIDKMQSLHDRKEHMLELYTEVQMEIARKRGEGIIAAVGLDMQNKLGHFVKVKIDEINDTVIESHMSFRKKMRMSLEDAETYRDLPTLYEASLKASEEQMTLYFETMKKLIDGFSNAMNVKVAQYKT